MLACFTIYDTIRDGILIAEPRHQPYITCPGQHVCTLGSFTLLVPEYLLFSAHIYFIQMIYTKLNEIVSICTFSQPSLFGKTSPSVG